MKLRNGKLSLSLGSILLLLLTLLFRETPELLSPRSSASVADGDTITMEIEGEKETIRYLLIDTPELHHPSRPVEELGKEAREENLRLLSLGPLRLELDKERRDRYGRLLAYVWVKTSEGEIMVNEELVRKGLALPLIIPPNGKYTDRIFSAMAEARKEGRGLWGRAAKRIFTPAQLWNEAPYLAGSFVTVRMTVEKAEKKGRRLFLRQGQVTLSAYRDPETEALWKVKPGDRISAAGKVVLSHKGCEMPLVSHLQVTSTPLP